MTAPEASNLAITVGGLAVACLGVGLQWGVAPGLMLVGTVCFMAGALSAHQATGHAARRPQDPRR